jgi:outer membrane protein assembly factor BamB
MRRITMVLVSLAMVFLIAHLSLAAMGDVVDQFPVPDEISHVFDNGIAWDGDDLWVPCRSPLGGYYLGPRQIDPETGQLTGKALPNTAYSVAGIAFDRSKKILWHLAYPCGPIYGVNVDTGSTVMSFSPGVCWLHDIGFDGRHLLVTKDNGTVYQFDPDTGEMVGSFVGPGGITNPYGEGPNLQGVTYDGRYFWFTRGAGDGSDNQRYYKVDPEIALPDGHSDNAIVDYFDLPFASTLASDGKYLWTSYYDSVTEMKMIAKIDTGPAEPIEPECPPCPECPPIPESEPEADIIISATLREHSKIRQWNWKGVGRVDVSLSYNELIEPFTSGVIDVEVVVRITTSDGKVVELQANGPMDSKVMPSGKSKHKRTQAH